MAFSFLMSATNLLQHVRGEQLRSATLGLSDVNTPVVFAFCTFKCSFLSY